MQKSKISAMYKSVSLETASPGKIILMLYDGALKFLDKAKAGFTKETRRESNESVNNNIIRAQAIIGELKASLDHSVSGDFPQVMNNLYEYMETLLAQANVKKEKEPIEEVEKHLKEIRNAWSEMLTKQDKEAINASSISCSA